MAAVPQAIDQSGLVVLPECQSVDLPDEVEVGVRLGTDDLVGLVHVDGPIVPDLRRRQEDRPEPTFPTPVAAPSPESVANALSISATSPDRWWAKTSRYSIALVQPT